MSETEEFEFALALEKERGAKPKAASEPFAATLGRGVLNAGAGAIRGAGDIGATLLAPYDMARDALDGKGLSLASNRQRRDDMTDGLQSMGADPNSLWFQGGRVLTNVGGTMGVGGAAANVLTRAAPTVAARAAPALEAIRTAGMTAGGVTGMTGLGLRTAGGAINGGLAAGMVDPSTAGQGALLGGAMPGAFQVAGKAGNALGSALRSSVTPEVAALAQRAKALGIDIPADRLVSSKPMDAIASGLNYVPFSGRAATEARMGEQLNTAASRLIGQNTSNMSQAIRAASGDLGAKFDATLRTTGVQFDQQLLSDVSRVFNVAERELGSDALKAISSQVDDLVAKGATGVVDGQAAYNIKRTLDRIGRRNGPEAWHALELKGVLMDALNRSLGPKQAAAFATTRQQYGNMLALEKLAKNGVEGEISVARLANMQNINNQPLQELADIAAQFVKAREGQHGAMQRAMVGMGTASVAGLPGLALGATAGRAANGLLNSNTLRNAMTGGGQPNPLAGLLADLELQQAVLRAAPTALNGQ